MSKDQGFLYPYLILLPPSSLLYRYSNHFQCVVVEWHPPGTISPANKGWGCFSVIIFSSLEILELKPIEWAWKWEGRRMVVHVLYPPSWCPPDKFSHSLGLSLVQKGRCQAGQQFQGSLLIQMFCSSLSSSSVYFKRILSYLSQYLCSPPLHTAIHAVMTSKHPHCISTIWWDKCLILGFYGHRVAILLSCYGGAQKTWAAKEE